MGEMMSRSPVQMAPDTSSAGQLPLCIVIFIRSSMLSLTILYLQDAAGEIIKGLASVPAPGKVFNDKIDPV